MRRGTDKAVLPLTLLLVSFDAGAATCPERASELLDSLVHHDYARATQHFDKKMADALPESKLKTVFGAAELQYGALEAHGEMKEEPPARSDVVTMSSKLTFDRGALKAVISCDTVADIAGLHLRPVD